MDISPILISLKTASVSIVITFFLGIIVARLVMLIKNDKLQIVVDSILTLPLVFPPTIIGFFILYTFGAKRPIGEFLLSNFGITIAFSWGSTVIAAVIISFPLMYRAAKAAFEQVDRNLIYAGQTIGLSNNKIFWKITVPLSWRGLLSGTILAFARGFGEFGATAMIAGNIAGKTRTLPLAVYSAVSAGDMQSAYDYVLVILVISLVLMFLINWIASYEGNFDQAK